MFEKPIVPSDLEAFYDLCKAQLQSLLDDEANIITSLSNMSALIHYMMDHINWVGFYLAEGDELVLGPFQGLPACTRIKIGNGVCGTSAKLLETVNVPDVDAFPGHIACDSASKSEIVIPIRNKGTLYGVLDIDSPIPNRFSAVDQLHLEQLVHILEMHLKFK